MNTPDDVFDLIDKPEDITPPMARERAISEALLAALRLAHGDKALFRDAEKARDKKKRTKYRTYTQDERDEWHRLYAEGKMTKTAVAKACGVPVGPVCRELTAERYL